MIKMLVCSFINTLINEEDAISVGTMLEIERIRKNNKLFTVLTNRGYEEVLYYNRDYPFIDYIASLNGSVIYDVKRNSIVKKKSLSKKNIKLLEETFTENNKKYYTENQLFNELPNQDIYKIEIELTRKDKFKLESLNIDYSILEIGKTKYLEVTEKNTYEFLNDLLVSKKIKNNEVYAIIGNDNEKDFLNKLSNVSITKRCTSILKDKIKKSNMKLRKMRLEEILKKIWACKYKFFFFNCNLLNKDWKYTKI